MVAGIQLRVRPPRDKKINGNGFYLRFRDDLTWIDQASLNLNPMYPFSGARVFLNCDGAAEL